jgi:hypothetical protein
MITVASLVFSMTLVTLTLAASSIGARLLDSYIANRVNQVALGLFLATFVYSLIVLRAVIDDQSATFVCLTSLPGQRRCARAPTRLEAGREHFWIWEDGPWTQPSSGRCRRRTRSAIATSRRRRSSR